jgi:hypothetical protein
VKSRVVGIRETDIETKNNNCSFTAMGQGGGPVNAGQTVHLTGLQRPDGGHDVLPGVELRSWSAPWPICPGAAEVLVHSHPG